MKVGQQTAVVLLLALVFACGETGTDHPGGTENTELTDQELEAYMWGFWDGLLLQSYPCSSDTDCLTGEFCSAGGLCQPPPPCDEPHPNSDEDQCKDDCFHRYQSVVRYSVCLQSCRCFEYTGDRVCRSEDNCLLPWTDCVEGRCQFNDLTVREMLPIR